MEAGNVGAKGHLGLGYYISSGHGEDSIKEGQSFKQPTSHRILKIL